jgi:hypothetical protein
MKTLLLFSSSLLLAGSTGCFAMTYDDWRSSKFSIEQLSDPTISGEDADPDGDSKINFMEFALDTDPLLNEQTGWTAWRDTSGRMNLRFVRRVLPSGFFYAPQVSGNLLEPWQTGPLYLDEVSVTSRARKPIS